MDNLFNKYESKLSDFNTDEIATNLKELITGCDKVYFAPLSDPSQSGDVPIKAIALIGRLTSELTSRYLLSKI